MSPALACLHLLRGNRSLIVLILLGMPACGEADDGATSGSPETSALHVRACDPPAAADAFFPRVHSGADGVVRVCWMEARTDATRLCFARWQDGDWSDAQQIAAGDDWFVNWADFPSICALESGELAAHWLQRLGEETYAYGVRVCTSTDGGASWGEAFWLHDDESPTEHGFASLVADGDRFRGVWLDGRAMPETEEMQLRTVHFDVEGVRGEERVLDPRVCECCSTTAVLVGDRLVVRARDRSKDETRDILSVFVTGTGDGTADRAAAVDEAERMGSAPVWNDGWERPG